MPSEAEALPESFLDATCDAHIDYWSQVLTEDNVGQVTGMAYAGQLLHRYVPWLEDAADEPDLASDPVSVIERVCPTDNH